MYYGVARRTSWILTLRDSPKGVSGYEDPYLACPEKVS